MRFLAWRCTAKPPAFSCLFPLTSNDRRRTLQAIHKGQNWTDQRVPRCRSGINLLKQKSRKVLTARSQPATSSLFPLPRKPTRQHSGPTVPTNPPTHQHQTMWTMKTTTIESKKATKKQIKHRTLNRFVSKKNSNCNWRGSSGWPARRYLWLTN